MAAGVLRGRPIALREDAARAGERARANGACNKGPRYSLAAMLDEAELRRAKAMPWTPGRLPAPRQELSCLEGGEPSKLQPVVFPDFARGASPLPPNTPGGPPVNPPVGPGPDSGPGPQPNPGPAPAPGPGPGPGPGPDEPPCDCGPDGENPMPGFGFPRTIAFHLTGTLGGSIPTELRVSPRIDRPFIIRSVEVIPISAAGVGQFVDVLISQQDWQGDEQFPQGQSIFLPQQGLADLPAEDQDVGLPVGPLPFDVPMAYAVRERSRTIMVQSRFTAPAAVAPACHVVVAIEEYENLDMPIRPRPPLRPPYAPPPGPPPAEPPPIVVNPAPPAPPRRSYCGPRLYEPGPVCPLPRGAGVQNLSTVEFPAGVSDALHRQLLSANRRNSGGVA